MSTPLPLAYHRNLLSAVNGYVQDKGGRGRTGRLDLGADSVWEQESGRRSESMAQLVIAIGPIVEICGFFQPRSSSEAESLLPLRIRRAGEVVGVAGLHEEPVGQAVEILADLRVQVRLL